MQIELNSEGDPQGVREQVQQAIYRAISLHPVVTLAEQARWPATK